MRTSITVAAIAAVASTVAAYEYEEDIFAREADAEPILGLNHMGKWVGQAFGSVKEGYNQKAHGSDHENDYNSHYGRDIEDLEEFLAVREAEPILGLNHMGKWIGQAVGSVKGGYNQKANAGMSGSEHSVSSYTSIQQYKRDLEDLEELLAIREAEAEAEPILGLNHMGKWIGQAVGSVKGGYNQKANAGMGGSGYSSHEYSQQYKRDLEDLEELLAIREAEAEPILGLNHMGKWIGQAAGSVKAGFNKKAGGGMSGGMGGSEYSQQQYRRDLDALEILLAIREADAEAEPILGLNHMGKWIGQAAGSVKAGFNKKANPQGPISETTISMGRRDLFEDDEYDF